MAATRLSHRVATHADADLIQGIMCASLAENMRDFLSPLEIAAAQEMCGLDTTLIDDETYFIVDIDSDDGPVPAGCGGWGKRLTLYGGDHTGGRDDSFSDPQKDAARIRAMYTHPDWIRRGVGRYLITIAEAAARNAGFKTMELGATLPGEPLYRTAGYEEYGREESLAANGATNVIVKMRKSLITDLQR